MKFLYASSLTFPSGMSNRLQTLSMVGEFSEKLGEDFYFGFSLIRKNASMESYSEYFDRLNQSRLFEAGEGRSYRLAFKLLRFILKEKIDFVYCREPRLLLCLMFYSRLLFWRLGRIKFIFEVHKKPSNFLDNIAHWLIFKTTDYFIFITSFLRDFYLKHYNFRKGQGLISPDCVDLNIFDLEISKEQAREKAGFPQDKKIIGYFGRFITMGMTKGLDTLLAGLKFSDEDTILLMMGGKPKDIEYYRQMAKKMGISDRVIFIRHSSQKEVALRQKACDILLMAYPNVEHYAKFMSPAKLFEHMASKRPIVSSDLPSIREILNDNSAYFFKPSDAKDLAEKIEAALQNKEASTAKAMQSYENVKQYTWQKRIDNILHFINAVN